MCGITGYIGNRDAAPLLIESLRKLEYRGYDSAGIATIESSELNLRKDQGKLSDLDSVLDPQNLPGNIGIGHTRWATHGKPSQANSHPHTACDNKVAIVHNGIIENYIKIKQKLMADGHTFMSETDSEVLAHLIESKLDQGFETAVKDALSEVKGAFSIAAICPKEPDKIIVAKNHSPLIIGHGNGEMFIGSDIPAFLSETNKITILDTGEMAVLTKEGVEIKQYSDGKVLDKEIKEVDWTPEDAEKGGYPYFALKEIEETPEAIRATLNGDKEVEEVAKVIQKFNKIFIIGSGTSYHAGLIGKYLFEQECGIRTDVVLSSEFPYSAAQVVDSDTLVIAISQSGETSDAIRAVNLAKEKGATIVGIVNTVGSTLDREADHSCHLNTGPEIAVIATKTFVAQLMIFYMLAALIKGETIEALKQIPELMQKTLDLVKEPVKKLSDRLKDKENVYFIGRGLAYPLLLEGALKFKEITYIHGEGMPAGELKHGTLSLITDGIPVVTALLPDGYEKTIGNLQEVLARGGEVFALTFESDEKLSNHVKTENTIKVPDTENKYYPLNMILPLQLLAYYTTVKRGLDPDKPRNLAKSVTVE